MKALELIRNARTKKCKLAYIDGMPFNFIRFTFPNTKTSHWYYVWDDGTVNFHHSYDSTGRTLRGLKHQKEVDKAIGFYFQ